MTQQLTFFAPVEPLCSQRVPLVRRTWASRSQWLGDVETATHAWRQHRASEYERQGYRVVEWDQRDWLEGNDARFDYFLTAGVRTILHDDYFTQPTQSRDPLPVPKWHADRAEAQRQRWSRLAECGATQVVSTCECGAHVPRAQTIHCDHWRLCVACRGRRKQRYQARFNAGRGRALKRLAHLANRSRPSREGRWSEKMLTLTVPHSGSAADDIVELRRAWPLLRARIARYLKRRGAKEWRAVPYWRSLEITDSDRGHAHYHVWLFAPFLPREVVAHWWASSLSPEYRARVPRRRVEDLDDARDAAIMRVYTRGAGWYYAPVVDLRAANADAGRELVKYLVKDSIGEASEGRFTEPRTFASIYAALDGARALATSTRWLETKERECWCESCGARLGRRLQVVDPVKRCGADPPQ